MAKALLAGYVNPADVEQEAEFNRWYDQTHIPQVLERIAGVVGARRYRLAAVQVVDADALPAHRYLSLYELDTEDLPATANRLLTAMGDGTLDMTDALDTSSTPPVLHFYDVVR
ncbi:hypothetical protein HH308_24285 [Gordonia sp. TBRC 11910]|uniref:EthD domain-containing protein n=1 Tax=Gordonia asplenii TaxID=2725283 RepID=A0A848L1L1_9ACTN|nr:DUF4286 family protein [Gordonia asplenii]NMO04342.1 hypothetical protein [Gordonia asplenii]